MKIFLTLITVLTISYTTLQAQVNEQDSLVLVDLYQAAGGQSWHSNDHWLSGAVSDWFGITVQDGRVSRIELYDNGLAGTIPESIGDLGALEYLQLSENELTGEIPSSIGNLGKLGFFGASSNMLGGQIPQSIGNCQNLYQMNIADNLFEGSFPPTLKNCTQLTIISAFNNYFTGPFPEVFLEMPWLESLILENNNFTGPVPAGINELVNLHSFDILNNVFSGPMPRIDNLVNLSSLHLDGNNLSGVLDTILGDHPNMFYLTVNNNKFSGKISHWHFSADRLEYGHFQYNDFDSVDDWSAFADTGVLRRFFVSGNMLDFDDLEPNANLSVQSFRYDDQDSIGAYVTAELEQGQNFTMSSPMSGPEITYNWYKDGKLIEGADGSGHSIQDFSAQDAGVYSFEATHPDFPDLTMLSRTWTLQSEATAVDRLDQDFLEIFPNPATEFIRIRMQEAVPATQFILRAPDGSLIRSYGEVPTGEIDVSDLPSGIYALELETGQGRGIWKFVKR